MRLSCRRRKHIYCCSALCHVQICTVYFTALHIRELLLDKNNTHDFREGIRVIILARRVLQFSNPTWPDLELILISHFPGTINERLASNLLHPNLRVIPITVVDPPGNGFSNQRPFVNKITHIISKSVSISKWVTGGGRERDISVLIIHKPERRHSHTHA